MYNINFIYIFALENKEIIMWVKVDYSTEAKKKSRINMGGEYAIYTKKHWWNKWVERNTYADVELCKRDAEKLVEYPKYFHKLIF